MSTRFLLLALLVGCSPSIDIEMPCLEVESPCSSHCACAVQRFAECGTPLPWLVDGPEPRPALCQGFVACLAQCELAAPCDVLARYLNGPGIGPDTDLWHCNKACGAE